MEREQFETMIALQRTFRTDAVALFQEYQKLHLEILGDRNEIRFDLNRQIMATGDFVLDESATAESLKYLPELPKRDEWEEEHFAPYPSLFERMLQHSELCFQQSLGYEYAHNYFKLPFAWLFDPAWKEKATAKLQKRAEEIRNAYELQQKQQHIRDLAELQRLTTKYGEKS